MARILPRDLFIGIVLFAMVSTGIVYLLTSITTSGQTGQEAVDLFEGVDADRIQEFNRTFVSSSNITSKVNKLEDEVNKLNVDKPTDILTVGGALISSGWTAVTLILGSVGYMTTAIGGLTTYLGVPSFVPAFIIVIITVIVIFSILAVIFGKDL